MSFLLQAVPGCLLVLALGGGGCGREHAAGPDSTNQAVPAASATCDPAENWCIEHGVPENICARCNAKVAADCKQKGDWCQEHDRPKSQCFLCDPKLQAKFAEEYEILYGKKPPAAKAE